MIAIVSQEKWVNEVTGERSALRRSRDVHGYYHPLGRQHRKHAV